MMPLAFIDQPESIFIDQESCTISASIHIETIRKSGKLQALFPQVVDDFKSICSSAIRQQATLGGNFVNASPIGDLSVFFLALDAQLSIHSATNQRRVALRHFFLDYKQVDLQEGELIREIDFQYPESPIRLSFEKVSKRQHLDIASVNSAMSVSVQDDKFKQIHISLGGVLAIPLYLQKTCAFLQDKKIAIDLLKQALAVVQTEIFPLSDIRGSAEYKRLLAQQLLIAHWLKLLPEYVSWEDFQ
jgi:xanthine dehydrogenase small subunit